MGNLSTGQANAGSRADRVINPVALDRAIDPVAADRVVDSAGKGR